MDRVRRRRLRSLRSVYEQIGKRVQRIRQQSGGERHWHMLRNTFAQRFLDGGVSVEALPKMMGHADITTTATYSRPSDRLVRNEARRVWIGQK